MKKKTWKKIYSSLAAISFVFCISGGVEAASRAELSAIHVESARDFKYWNKDAESYKALVNYVEDVTNSKSKNYIPEKDRVAVFDLDGTLLGERTPCYFEWMMYLERALNDPNYTPNQADYDYALVVKDAIAKGKIPADMEKKEAMSQASVFAGMTPAEYETWVKNFMNKPVEGLTNITWGEEFYLPMVEVVSYLEENDFEVYVVSGSDRAALRVLCDGIMDIEKDHFIGTDVWMLASGQGDKDGLDYMYKKGDQLVRGQFILKDVKMNKVHNIAQEIGRQPVLAFGNSSGDSSMFNYTINNNKYKSLAFALCCDDLERELGDTAKADAMYKSCAKNGWQPVSMKNDFKTIYGDNVKRADRSSKK